MDRLRPRKRKTPSEFTNSEVHELEYYLKELGEKSLNQKFCAKIADALSRSVGRAGKPRVTYDEIQRWLQDKHQELMEKAKCISAQPQQNIMFPDGDGCKPMNFQEQCITIGVPSSPELNEDSHGPVEVQEQCIPISTQVPSSIQFNGSTCQTDASPDLVVNADASTGIKAHEQSTSQVPSCSQIKECSHFYKVDEPFMEHPDACIPNRASDTDKFKKAMEKCSDLSEVEFEARSSKDEAWYDVERILTHRILSSGEAEVRVRYVGYGAEEDEWVNVKKSVRQRSLPIEHWECYRVKDGDLVLCFQDREDQAIYYDAHVLEVQRRMHDIRGCRCIFLVRYDHDKTEEKVRLRRLCRRP